MTIMLSGLAESPPDYSLSIPILLNYQTIPHPTTPNKKGRGKHSEGTILAVGRKDHLSLFARRIFFLINSAFLESPKITKKREKTFPSPSLSQWTLTPPSLFFIFLEVAVPFK
jgi:hypothetical protein